MILQFSNYIFTHVMVKSIFLEKNIEQKKTFISFSSSLHSPNFYLDVTIKHVKSFQVFFSYILFLSSVSNNWWGLFKEECNVVTSSWLSPGFAHLTHDMSENLKKSRPSIKVQSKIIISILNLSNVYFAWMFFK